MVIACLGFAANDACMKALADHMSIYQAIFLRGVVATAVIGFIAWQRGELLLPVPSPDRWRIGWRSVGEIGAAFCYLQALVHIPMANASAILQSLPLVITLAAAIFFGERVGWRRYAAIATGFLGVLLIVRPGPAGFDVSSFWVIASVLFIVLRDLSTRRISETTSTTAVVFVTSLVLTPVSGALTVASGWTPVAPIHLATLLLAAAVLLVAYVFSVQSMRTGEIGFVQPFRYVLLLWSIVLGILVFHEWPDPLMLVGAVIVVGTGLFTLRRERAARIQETANGTVGHPT